MVFLGDSLTEGYGLQKEEAYPALVENLIKSNLQKDIKVINGGVSGSTTSDGLARLKWYLRAKPSIIFIALGANDGLRGLNLNKSQQSLEKIIKTAQKSGAKVILAGMLIPPNYGQEYANQFKVMFENIQKKYNLKTIPFLLKDVAGIKELNQRDGIHPNKQGQITIARNVFEFLKEDL
jgi:acyl-CoA thioesterase-1